VSSLETMTMRKFELAIKCKKRFQKITVVGHPEFAGGSLG
jgi:hypothetical protein